MNAKTLAAIALALTGTLGAGLAQARPDVQWSVSIGAPMLPIFIGSAPAYRVVEPIHFYPPAVYVQPRQTYGRYEASPWDRDGDGVPNRYDRHDNRHGYRHDVASWDRDGDGVPNRYDRSPDNPWRR